jgi:hypoxanthine phosphoribosyltransferase
MRSYDYANRDGVEPVTWERFEEASRCLAERIESREVDLIVGVARGGLFPATAIACALRCEFFPVRLTRREADEVRHRHPVWRVPVSDFVEGRRVAIVDDVADTGETLEVVRKEVSLRGASCALTAALVCHSWAKPTPDFSGIQSDALVLLPWDREVLVEGSWVPHPELEEALKLQAGE